MPPFGDQFHAPSETPEEPEVVDTPEAGDAEPLEGSDPSDKTAVIDGKEYHETGQEGVMARKRTPAEEAADAEATGNTLYQPRDEDDSES